VPPSEGDPYIGATIAGKYRLSDLLGSGVMGRVYRAKQLQTGNEVAIKLINPESAADPQTAARFQQEARATSRLRHPNTIAILDFGQTESGLLYLVTELLHGRTLAEILAEAPTLPPRRVVDLLGQALSALDASHAASIVHRDFKPENCFVTPMPSGAEHVKVLDFGMAKLRGEQDPQLTASGSVCGTPDYMSPEQIRGEELDARSDVYAVGVVLYESLTGTRPHVGSMLEVLRRHQQEPAEPPRLKRPDLAIPVPLELVCLRALSKRREDRFRNAEEMRTTLLATLRDDPLRCSACGSSVPLGAHFCPACGSGVEDSLDVPPALAVPLLNLAFVGREEELASLSDLVRGAVLVIGPGGSGKSRLVEEWRKRLSERSVVMRPDPTGAGESWRPVRRALAQVLQVGERPTEAELQVALQSRPTDRVGVLEVFGIGPAPAAWEMELRQREAIAASVGILREGNVTLICEDADRYDRRSTEVVARLIADPGTARIVVTSSRRGELGTATTIMLGPLPPRALGALGMKPAEVGQTDGLPLTIEQRLRAKSEGAADPSAKARLSLLPPNARRALSALAVGGMEADQALLGEVLKLSDVSSAALLLARRGLVRFVSDATSESPGLSRSARIELPSPTLRDRIYEALDPLERRALHQAWLTALGARGRGPMVLAHHEWHADPKRATLALLEKAAAAAERAGDLGGAARWRNRCLERVTDGDATPAERARVAVACGEALLAVGDAGRAETCYREAMGTLVSASDPLLEARARRGMARLSLVKRELEPARMELKRALDLAGGDRGLLVDVALELADVLARLGKAPDAEVILQGALGQVVDAPEVAWRLRLALAQRAHERGSAGEAAELCRSALLEAERASPAAVAKVRAQLALASHASGDGPAAAAHRRAAMELLDRLGDRRAMAELLLAAALADTRDTTVARRWVAQAGELARQMGWREGVTRAREALRRLE
jgi:serine/threonine-protein kinase